MPPKTRSRAVHLNPDDLDLSELSNDGKIIIKILSDFFSDKIEEMKLSYENALAEREKDGLKLRNEYNLLKKDFDRLTERVEDLETNGRKQDLIISGPNTPTVQIGENLKSISEDFLKRTLKINLPENSIQRAARIGKKPTNSTSADRRSIILTLSSHELVQDTIRTAKTVKPQNVYLNENLTPTKHKIMQILRKSRRIYGNKISGCSSRHGRVSVWLKPPHPHVEGAQNLRMNINSYGELTDFCTRVLEVSLESLIAM